MSEGKDKRSPEDLDLVAGINIAGWTIEKWVEVKLISKGTVKFFSSKDLDNVKAVYSQEISDAGGQIKTIFVLVNPGGIGYKFSESWIEQDVVSQESLNDHKNLILGKLESKDLEFLRNMGILTT